MAIKKLTGIVINISGKNTAIVQVSRLVRHAKYQKIYKKSKNFLIDFKGELSKGDKVEIVSVKPMSKKKSFKLNKVIEKVVHLSEVEEDIL